jgi:hypothetical protein
MPTWLEIAIPSVMALVVILTWALDRSRKTLELCVRRLKTAEIDVKVSRSGSDFIIELLNDRAKS